ncbi:MAG: hypothetical protein QXO47_02260 [Thermoproteota archaeon]
MGKPRIIKLGTIDCDMVETTPIVFQNRLYRFEYVRPNYKPNKTGISFFHFIDVDSGESTSAFAHGYHLGSAYVDDDRVFAYGVDAWGGSKIRAFWSRDLKEWHSETALVLPGCGIYNNSICKAQDRYIMAIELGEPAEIARAKIIQIWISASSRRGQLSITVGETRGAQSSWPRLFTKVGWKTFLAPSSDGDQGF